MNYIGSKKSLLKFIFSNIHSTVGNNISDFVFCDLFAGTGIVGRTFKPFVKTVISNDLEYYSYVLNRNYIQNNSILDRSSDLLVELNNTIGEPGFIFEEFSEGGIANRLYFSEYNGKKIDAIRSKIEKWKELKYISDDEYFFLLCSLLESADQVANTASVYGAYLKKLKKAAQKKIYVEPACFYIKQNTENKVYQEDANKLISKIQGDILYLDPPYNTRQYGANYHLLNTIAKYKPFIPCGKTGLPNYNKSDYCRKRLVQDTFRDLIEKANFDYVFLSYNNEGLLSLEEIRDVMKNNGEYERVEKKHPRFRADASSKRNHIASSTIEYLHILKK